MENSLWIVLTGVSTLGTALFVGLTLWLAWKTYRKDYGQGKRIWPAPVDITRILHFESDIKQGEAWIHCLKVSGPGAKIKLHNVHFIRDDPHVKPNTIEYSHNVDIEEFTKGDPDNPKTFGHRFLLTTSPKTKKIAVTISMSVSWKPRGPTRKKWKIHLP